MLNYFLFRYITLIMVSLATTYTYGEIVESTKVLPLLTILAASISQTGELRLHPSL